MTNLINDSVTSNLGRIYMIIPHLQLKIPPNCMTMRYRHFKINFHIEKMQHILAEYAFMTNSIRGCVSNVTISINQNGGFKRRSLIFRFLCKGLRTFIFC